MPFSGRRCEFSLHFSILQLVKTLYPFWQSLSTYSIIGSINQLIDTGQPIYLYTQPMICQPDLISLPLISQSSKAAHIHKTLSHCNRCLNYEADFHFHELTAIHCSNTVWPTNQSQCETNLCK